MIRIASNAVIAKILDADDELKLEINDLLSYQVAGAENMSSFKSGDWSGRSTLFNFQRGTFPAGLLTLVYSHLKQSGRQVSLVRQPAPAPLGELKPIVNKFGITEKYQYQYDAVDALVKYKAMIAQIATGGGKCLGKDTPVLMFDGTVKAVQDVQPGNLLMGPDSRPRRVLTTCKGRSPLYRVTPNKGEPYVVNGAHILSLKKTCRGYRGGKRQGEKYLKGEVVNINVEEFLSQSKTFRHAHKGWRTGVNFNSTSSLPVEPYFVGALLGDGSISGCVSLTTADQELVAEMERQAEIWQCQLRRYPKKGNKASSYHLSTGMRGGKPNPISVALRSVGLGFGDKFVPEIYKLASREDRLALLAGVLDTDGYYDGKCMYLTLKNERLLDDVIFVARSLGFAAYKKKVIKRCVNNGVEGEYFSTVISGSLEQIPVRLERRKASPRLQKKDHLVTGLSIEAIGEGDYFGFEIDGDHLFLLGDFTVTHNSNLAAIAVARIKRPTLFLTTRSVLMHQMKRTFDASIEYRKSQGEDLKGVFCGIMGDGIWQPSKHLNVANVQTIMAKLRDPCTEKVMREILSEFEFVILEEAHESSGDGYYEILNACSNAHYRLALTATPFMKDDEEANMRLMAVSGPIGIKISERELIDKGILAKPYFKYIEPKQHPKVRKTSNWQLAYQYGVVENEDRNRIIVEECMQAKKHNLPTMILVQRKDHGKILRDLLIAQKIKVRYIFGESDKFQREIALDDLANGVIDVLIGSTILDVGVDVPAVGVVILAGAGKAEVALRQRIGRGLRAKSSDKPNVAFIVDFKDSLNKHLSAHAAQRRAIVESTDGFSDGILKSGEDFDYEVFNEDTDKESKRQSS